MIAFCDPIPISKWKFYELFLGLISDFSKKQVDTWVFIYLSHRYQNCPQLGSFEQRLSAHPTWRFSQNAVSLRDISPASDHSSFPIERIFISHQGHLNRAHACDVPSAQSRTNLEKNAGC